MRYKDADRDSRGHVYSNTRNRQELADRRKIDKLLFGLLNIGRGMERETGFEPATSTLARLHSTS